MTREEAIKIINCYDIGFYDLSGEKIPADKLVDAFDMAIEALSAEPRKGQWITNKDGYSICSECGFCFGCIECSHEETDFCPNCGADMRGEK